MTPHSQSPSRAADFGLGRTPREQRLSSTSVGAASEDADPQLFNGAVFESVNVPASVAVGKTLTITGVVGFDCPLCAVDRDVRVVAQIAGRQNKTAEVGQLNGRGETAPFELTIPAPQTAGGTISVRLQAQRKPPQPTAGWTTDNTSGPHETNVLTESEKLRQDAIGYVPWVVGGGAIGIGAAGLGGHSRVGGIAAGAGAGVATKIISEQSTGDIVPDFPTVPVVATAALLAGAGLLLGDLGPDAQDINLALPGQASQSETSSRPGTRSPRPSRSR